MKKLLFFSLGLLLTAASLNAAVLATNATAGGMHLLTTNRANILSVTLASDQNVSVFFYDAQTLAAPTYGTNYVTAAYPTRLSYATNYVTSFIGQNGITNWYTNAGMWSVTITNAAATNALPYEAFVIGANTAVSYDVNILNVNGITMRTSTNVNVVLNYNSGL